MKLSIIIPCLNEKDTIGSAILKANKAAKETHIKDFEIIVADNGSADGSLKVINMQKKARLVNVPILGYGAVLHWGILSAKGEYVFFADADLSYDFNQLSKFAKFLDSNVDLVLGSRFRGNIRRGAMPLLNRYLGTPLLTSLIRMIYGIKTTDCNSGMRMVKKSFYKKLNMKNSGMEWASELLIKTALNDGEYAEIPIHFRKDKRKRKSHLLPWADGWRHLKAIILLKPNSLTIPIMFLALVALISLRGSFFTSFFFVLFAIALFFSYLAAKMLNFAINGEGSLIVNAIQKLSIVLLAVILTLVALIFVLVIPSGYSELKIISISIVMIFDVWVFLIETIKTHLINRLPDHL